MDPTGTSISKGKWNPMNSSISKDEWNPKGISNFSVKIFLSAAPYFVVIEIPERLRNTSVYNVGKVYF